VGGTCRLVVIALLSGAVGVAGRLLGPPVATVIVVLVAAVLMAAVVVIIAPLLAAAISLLPAALPATRSVWASV
jgi:hypothetical protein